MKRNIKRLKKQHEIVAKKLQSLRQKIEEEKNKLDFPKIKREYEGKYFKYDNGFDNDHRWTMYVFCRRVKDCDYGMFDWFESEVGGNYNPHLFHVNQERRYNLCQTQITKKEYQSALLEFFNKMSRMFVGEKTLADLLKQNPKLIHVREK